jgi:RNA polymerase sigma-70 factor, ECF subfamily
MRKHGNLMNTLDNDLRLVIAQSRDQDEFQHRTDPYRRELSVHCYRILGSLEDAEDALQETFLRAWRRLDSLKEQTSLRAWLYKIATNVSLDMVAGRKARLLPIVTHDAADPNDSIPQPIHDPIWLDPLPDAYLDGYVIDPESRYEALESITLAFLMALQKLPGRQRAILVLRDVLGWKAQEVADLLNLTVVAVNSALQRARATMKKYQDEQVFDAAATADSEETTLLLTRYVRAWEAADSASLISLLREDAALTMPPLPMWFRGCAAIQAFLDKHLFTADIPARFRLVATRTNGCPAFAVYERDAANVYRPSALQVLTLKADQIVQIDDFIVQDNRLFLRFNLPDEL